MEYILLSSVGRSADEQNISNITVNITNFLQTISLIADIVDFIPKVFQRIGSNIFGTGMAGLSGQTAGAAFTALTTGPADDAFMVVSDIPAVTASAPGTTLSGAAIGTIARVDTARAYSSVSTVAAETGVASASSVATISTVDAGNGYPSAEASHAPVAARTGNAPTSSNPSGSRIRVAALTAGTTRSTAAAISTICSVVLGGHVREAWVATCAVTTGATGAAAASYATVAITSV
ncbi:hypothetical protein A5648_15950 [Mycolicibacter sinensis]|uniref:Uncharacterized protein n=1 Tax=Mycolicibacter sinensis (strain JDM601) TaxID=875328 RepID=A0A1A3U7U4_MYCSD|nr:hypothetical protein A5648_15950 [Mycolicibacter sinensis]